MLKIFNINILCDTHMSIILEYFSRAKKNNGWSRTGDKFDKMWDTFLTKIYKVSFL